MQPPRPTHTVKWYRRLDVRLAVMLVLALLGFEYFSKPVYHSVLKLFGFPSADEYVFIVDHPPTDGQPPHLEAYAANLAGLFRDQWRRAAAESRPPDATGGVLADLLRIQDEAFVMLDPDGRVVAKSAELPWELGSAWPFPVRSHSEVTRPADGRILAHAVYVPAQPGTGDPTFGLLMTDIGPGSDFVCDVTGFTQEVDSTGAPARVFMNEADYERQQTREARVVQVIWFLAMMGIAVLMAVVISRRVTRRLALMSSVASRPLPCGRLPGPFDESGGDEVARLAGTMNSMRLRVNQLLDDVARHEINRREWLAQVSHDLRTPLTALVACLDRAELALQSPRPETLYQEVPDLLAVAKLDIDRVESLANDLFEIARLEARDALNLEPVPPGELVRQAVRGLEPLAAKKGVKLQVRLGTRLPILSADGRRLMRALENLLRNAIQHAEAYVWIHVERDGDILRFDVRDDGVGFPDQAGPLSFDDLRTRRSREDSAGLGLTVTQKVAEAHGGSTGAHNFEGGGAVVWFSLPVSADSAEALEQEVGMAS